MADTVTTNCVLYKAVDPTRSDYLMLAYGQGDKHRVTMLPCRPKGQPCRGHGQPEWEYDEGQDGRLHMTPSLLCLDTRFHTAYNWDVAYTVKPEDRCQHELFYELNPDIES